MAPGDWGISPKRIVNEQIIGRGGEGNVYKGSYQNDVVAVKIVSKLTQNELDNLKKFDHPNIVKFHGVSTLDKRGYIIMEYCPDTLSAILRREKKVHRAELALWTGQIADGMHYLHSQRIIHRDLKSSNILIKKGSAKIADFGLHRIIDGFGEWSFVGTYPWMAPEVLCGKKYSEKADVWLESFGVVIWELFSRKQPYNSFNWAAIVVGVGKADRHLPLPKACPSAYRHIMRECWNRDPQIRPSFHDLKKKLENAGEILLKQPSKKYSQKEPSRKEQDSHLL